ncbi:MAG: DNA translocase FtsK 4TM domain-containing protein, partial [Lachnospiraceae bacterium]|nr:DNA translocase FtsK 4TM domain-containing protein [Lachnospiraceae bacterium]
MATGKQSAKRGTTRSTAGRAKKNTTATKRKKDTEVPSELKLEITILLLLAFSLVLILGNFGLTSVFGDVVNSFFFGLFGAMEYLWPFLLFFGSCFFFVNRTNKKALLKLFSVVALFFLLGMFLQLFATGEYKESSYSSVYSFGMDTRKGGGLFSGGLFELLSSGIGTAGTVALMIVLSIICIVVLTGRSFVDFVKKKGREFAEHAANSREEWKKDQEVLREERNLRRKTAREEKALRREAAREERLRQAREERARHELSYLNLKVGGNKEASSEGIFNPMAPVPESPVQPDSGLENSNEGQSFAYSPFAMNKENRVKPDLSKTTDVEDYLDEEDVTDTAPSTPKPETLKQNPEEDYDGEDYDGGDFDAPDFDARAHGTPNGSSNHAPDGFSGGRVYKGSESGNSNHSDYAYEDDWYREEKPSPLERELDVPKDVADYQRPEIDPTAENATEDVANVLGLFASGNSSEGGSDFDENGQENEAAGRYSGPMPVYAPDVYEEEAAPASEEEKGGFSFGIAEGVIPISEKSDMHEIFLDDIDFGDKIVDFTSRLISEESRRSRQANQGNNGSAAPIAPLPQMPNSNASQNGAYSPTTAEQYNPALTDNGSSQGTYDRTGNRSSQGTYDRAGNSSSQGLNGRAGNSPSQEANDRAGNRSSQGTYDRAGDRSSQGTYDRAGNRSSQGPNDRAGDRSSQGTYDRAGDSPSQGTYDRAGDSPSQRPNGRAGDSPSQEAYGRAGDNPSQVINGRESGGQTGYSQPTRPIAENMDISEPERQSGNPAYTASPRPVEAAGH